MKALIVQGTGLFMVENGQKFRVGGVEDLPPGGSLTSLARRFAQQIGIPFVEEPAELRIVA